MGIKILLILSLACLSNLAYAENSTAEAMGLKINAYPNPATIYTEFSYTLPYGIEDAILSIYDISGKLIEQITINNSIGKKAYNTSHLASGAYTYTIKIKDYSYSDKLIIQ